MNTTEPMNTPELPQAEVAIIPEEVKVEFEKVYKKLREQNQYLYVSHLINAITIILLLLFPLSQ